MAKRDLRQKLLSRRLDGDGELVIHDVSRSVRCERCGGCLEWLTVPMTGQLIEECRPCGTSHPIQRFLPVAEDEQ
jgi:hypothetical protein